MDANKIRDENIDEISYAILGIGATIAMLFNPTTAIVIVGFLFLCLLIFYYADRIKTYLPAKKEIPAEPEIKSLAPRQVLLGEKEGELITLDMDALGHMFIAGMTRYGKTKLLHALIVNFVTNFTENDLKIAFSDAKGVSFTPFYKSKHLFAPIAVSKEETEQLTEVVLKEMYDRLALFREYANDNLCTNVDDYEALTGERLPRIVVIFDELADSVEPDSIAEKNITTIAKMGLAAGIHLILSTQRPTKAGVTNEVQTQCQTVMSTYMKNKMEYGMITKIPKPVYENMRPVKGLFMIFSPELAPYFTSIDDNLEGWGFIKSIYIDNAEFAKVALENRADIELELPPLQPVIPAWEGSEDDKLEAIKLLEEKLGKNLERADLCTQFKISSRTAGTWLEKYYA